MSFSIVELGSVVADTKTLVNSGDEDSFQVNKKEAI